MIKCGYLACMFITINYSSKNLYTLHIWIMLPILSLKSLQVCLQFRECFPKSLEVCAKTFTIWPQCSSPFFFNLDLAWLIHPSILVPFITANSYFHETFQVFSNFHVYFHSVLSGILDNTPKDTLLALTTCWTPGLA